MAGARQSRAPSKASQRRSQQAQIAARQERLTLAAIGVLVAAGIIVAAGVVWGIILPPRAHVITVGAARFDARAVEQRVEFLVAGDRSSDDPIDAAVKMIRRDEMLLQVGASEAGDITADDITQAIRKRLGVADDASAEDYATAYAAFLKGTVLDRSTFERMVRAQVISDRLAKKFVAEVGDAGPQVHPLGAVSRDQNKLKQLREAVVGGADFAAKAVELGIASKAADADVGWIVPPDAGFLKDTVRLQDLPAGATTEVIAHEDGIQYFLYRMVERDEKHTYTDEQKTTLSERKVGEWIEAQRDRVTVTEDLSDRERRWILKRVTDAARTLAAQRAAVTSHPAAK